MEEEDYSSATAALIDVRLRSEWNKFDALSERTKKKKKLADSLGCFEIYGLVGWFG